MMPRAEDENAGPVHSRNWQEPTVMPARVYGPHKGPAHKGPARNPLAFINSNLPAGHTGSSMQTLQARGPLSSAILASRARHQQGIATPPPLSDCSTAGAVSPRPAMQPRCLSTQRQQQRLLQPQHPMHDPSGCSSSVSAAFSRQPAQVISTGHPGTGSTQHAAHGYSTYAPSWQQQPEDQRQHDVHADSDSESLAVPNTTGQCSNTPGSSAALQRLQHQQQLRWQGSRMAGAGADARSMGQAVPFTQHPAVSCLLSHHDNPLFDRSATPCGSAVDHPSTCSSRSAVLAHTAGQPSLVPRCASSAMHSAFTASSSASSCSGRPRHTGTAAGLECTQQAAAAAEADKQAILQRLQAAQAREGAATAQALERALLADSSGIHSLRPSHPPGVALGASTSSASTASRVGGGARVAHAPATLQGGRQHTAGSAAFAAGQQPLQAGQRSQQADMPSAAQMAAPFTQLPQRSHQSSIDSDACLTAGPLRYADRREAGLAGMPCLAGQLPGVQSQQAEHMFVKFHRSQRQRQTAVEEYDVSTHSTAEYSLFPAPARQARTSSSTAWQQPEVAASAGKTGPPGHLPVDIDLLPLPGPLTASLRVSRGAVGTSKPYSSLAAAVAHPGMPLSAQHGNAGSILDTIQLKWEGGSSAAAIQGIMSACSIDSAASRPAPGKALELLAGKAAAFAAKLPGRPSKRPVSRLHAASYPAAPSQHGASALARPAAAQASASTALSGGVLSQQGALQNNPAYMNGTLHAAVQLQDTAPAPQPATSSSSSCSSGGLQGSRLSLWQRQSHAGPDSAKRLTVSGELRASITGALRRVSGAVRGSTGAKQTRAAAVAAAEVVHSGAPCVTQGLSPAAPFLSSNDDSAEVFLTPEAAESSSNSGGESLLGSSRRSSGASDSLADTAQSTYSYALQQHTLGLSRGTPYVGLTDDGVHDNEDYYLTALHEHHGKAPHSATYWIARQRDDRAAQLGSRACRRLTWDETGTRRPPQQQQVKYQQHRHAAAQQPHGQPVQPARSRAQVHAASCLTIEEALEQQEREWQRLDRTAARLLRMVRRGRCKPWKTAPAKL